MKKIIIPLCAVLLVASAITAGGLIKAANSPTKTATPYSSEIVDRININIDSTSFTYGTAAEGGYEFSFTLTAEKTEADFYARIDSFEITGLEYTSIVFEALNDTPDKSITDSLVLSANNGEATEYSWKITVYTATKPASATAEICYTSGLTELTSESHIKQISLTFK